jgi:hypothetical protein
MDVVFWLLAACLTAAMAGVIATPLLKGQAKIAGWALVAILPLVALGIYLLTGNPDMVGNY